MEQQGAYPDPDPRVSDVEDEALIAKLLFHEGTKGRYQLESWYSKLQNHALKAKTILITHAEAMSVLKYKNNIKKIQNEKKGDGQNNLLISSELADLMGEESTNTLMGLKRRLDDEILSFFAKDNSDHKSRGIYITLSKNKIPDSSLITEDIRQYVVDEIKSSKNKSGSKESDIEDMIFYTRANAYALRIFSGKEAIQLLSRSRQIFKDFMRAELSITSQEEEDEYSFPITIREWNPRLLPEWEFRVFVWYNELTVGTQTNANVFVPEILENKDKISKLIESFWKTKVRDSLGHLKHYSLDIAVTSDLSDVSVIEVNPPPPVVDGGLWDWRNIQEKRKIMHGNPFELKLNTDLPVNFREKMVQPLRKIIQDERDHQD